MRRSRAIPWQQELNDFVRAFSGAFLFGIPLLFTMEMWWLGEYVGTGRMLWMLAVAGVANLGLAYAAGFKRGSTFATHADQAIDAVAVGAAGSGVVLLVLNRISPSDPLESIVGKIVVQILPLSIGASLANAVFAGGTGRAGDGRQDGGWRAAARDMGAAATGAVFIGSTVAPTEEIPMLAAGLDYPHLLGLIGFSLLVSYGIVFASGFDPRSTGAARRGFFQRPLTETTLAYLVALAVSFGSLYLLHRVGPGDPLYYVIEQTLVLGLPCSVGGAAGRVAV